MSTNEGKLTWQKHACEVFSRKQVVSETRLCRPCQKHDGLTNATCKVQKAKHGKRTSRKYLGGWTAEGSQMPNFVCVVDTSKALEQIHNFQYDVSEMELEAPHGSHAHGEATVFSRFFYFCGLLPTFVVFFRCADNYLFLGGLAGFSAADSFSSE